MHRASTVSKHFFINPTDAHCYKIIGMLKTIKIPTVAPTCFGSRRNHHQGAISCLAKTTIMILFCSSITTASTLCCAVHNLVRLSRLRLKCDGTHAETRFRLSAKRTSPFKSAGASVQSTTGSRGVRISGSNAGYTMFRGSVKSTGNTLHYQVPLFCTFSVYSASIRNKKLPAV